MSEISEEIRYVMLFYYKKGKNAAQTCRKICEVYGVDAVDERRTQEWFVRFRSGNFDVKDRPRQASTSRSIWQGIVEWIEKAKNPTDAQKQTRHISCQISANSKDGDPELKMDTWPPKLIMQLMPKQLIASVGDSYLKNSKSVVFHPTPCEALESLTKVMSAGLAGCVHFISASSACEIKVLILLYTTIGKKNYLGFIPNNQTAFVDRLRKVIQQEKNALKMLSKRSQNASVRQANPGPGNMIPAPMSTTGTQRGILMSQTNTMAMGGDQITQNVVSTAPPQTLTSTSEISEEIRYVMLFYYKKGKNAAQTCRKICEVYGANAVGERRIQEWFVRFRSGNFDVKDRPRSGQPVTEKVNEILQLVEQDRHVSCQEIANALRINNVTVWKHLKEAGYAKKLDVWVPHELTQRHLIDRVSISETLLKCNEIDPFLKRIITGDEKWIKYKNIVRKRSWDECDDPPQTTANQVMLCVWWDWKGIVHHEVLSHGLTINSELYCSQLDRLQEAIKKKRPELINRKEDVVFHHDNTRPHTSSLMTRQKLMELGWEILMHPPYSPDLAPSDYHLFRSLQNSLYGKTLADKRAVENHLKKFFADKPQKFYTDGIMKLPEKWQKSMYSEMRVYTPGYPGSPHLLPNETIPICVHRFLIRNINGPPESP